MKCNVQAPGGKYREITRVMGVRYVDRISQEEYRKAAIDAVKRPSEDVRTPKTLKEIGIKKEDLQALAESAMVDACTPGNPRDTSVAEILEIYKSIY